MATLFDKPKVVRKQRRTRADNGPTCPKCGEFYPTLVAHGRTWCINCDETEVFGPDMVNGPRRAAAGRRQVALAKE